MTQDPIVPSADLCEYLYANNYDIDEILPECDSLETITQLSSDPETRSLLRGLTGHDHFIDAQHIQKNRLDQLCCTDVTRKWTSAQMASVEKAFIDRGWLQQKRWYPCDFPSDPDASFTVSVPGNPNVGTVIFIRDHHWSAEAPAEIQQALGGNETKMMVYAYKLKELRTLLELRSEHVFI